MIVDGIYAAQLVTGERCVLNGDHLDTHLGVINLPGEDILFIDITAVGGFKITGQGHQTGAAWQYQQATGQWTEHGNTCGVSPCIFDRNGNLVIAQCNDGTGSQGYRYNDDNGQLVTGDDSLNEQRRVALENGFKELWEYTFKGGIAIGQGSPGVQAVILGQHHMVLNEPNTRFIKVDRQGDNYAIAVTLLGTNQCEYLNYTRAELEALSLVAEEPKQPPVVVIPPPTQEPPVSATDDALKETDLDRLIKDVLDHERGKFLNPLPTDRVERNKELGRYLNHTVQVLVDQGHTVALEWKPGAVDGNNAIQPVTGEFIANDIIQTFEGGVKCGRDFLGNTDPGGPATPVLGKKGLADRRSIPPVREVVDTPPVIPPDDDDSDFPPDDDDAVDMSGLLTVLTQLVNQAITDGLKLIGDDVSDIKTNIAALAAQHAKGYAGEVKTPLGPVKVDIVPKK